MRRHQYFTIKASDIAKGQPINEETMVKIAEGINELGGEFVSYTQNTTSGVPFFMYRKKESWWRFIKRIFISEEPREL